MAQINKKIFGKYQAIDGLYEIYAKHVGLSFVSLCIAEFIYEQEDGCTQKMICEKTHYPKQNVNIFVKFLWKNKYIRLEELASDRRNKKIVLTSEGRKYLEKIIKPLWKMEESAFSSISEKDQVIFLECLSSFENALRKEINELKNK